MAAIMSMLIFWALSFEDGGSNLRLPKALIAACKSTRRYNPEDQHNEVLYQLANSNKGTPV
jgi:hypothetical protein